MSKKFSVSDLLNDKSKEETKKLTDNIEINQIPIERIIPPDKSQYSTCVTSRTITLIAAEINNIKEQTRKMVLYNSIEIGRRLVEAKQMLAHGEWGNWLKESVDYSQRTANNLMRIFQEYGSEQITLIGDNSKSQAFANLSYSQAIALLEIPGEEREEFIKGNDVESMSTRELQKAIKEKQTLEDKLKVAEKASNNNLEKAEKLKKELEFERIKNKEALVNREVEIENLKNHIETIKKKLSKAESSGDNEEIEKLQLDLRDSEASLIWANRKIEELEQKLREKPIEVIASNEVIRFSIYFEEVIKKFESLIGALKEIQEDEVKEEYKKMVKDIIEEMVEKL